MLTPIVLVIVLMVATCVIAYWSDNLGKKLGKKRITLFNLRPRQTATLITMASSVGIMLLTLAGLLFVNKNLRRALFRYDKVSSSLSNVQINLNKVQVRYDTAMHELTLTQKQTGKANQDKEKAEQASRKAEAERRIAAQGRDAAQQDLEKAKKELDTAQQDLKVAQNGRHTAEGGQRRAESKAQTAEARATNAQTRYLNAQTRYTQAQNRFTQAQARLTQVQGRLANTQTHLASAQTRLAEAQRKAGVAQRTAINAQRVAINAQRISVNSVHESVESANRVIEAEKRLASLQHDLAETERALNAAQQARNDAENAALQARALNVGFQAGAVIVTPDSILASGTIPAQQSRGQLEAQLHNALRSGSEFAQHLGTSEQPVQGVTLEKISLLNGDNKPTYTLSSDQIIPALAQHLENSPTPISLILLPTRFHVLGEKSIEARFVYLEVKTIFREGEVMSHVTVNANASDTKLFEALQLLSDQGRAVAGNRGVPTLLASRSNFYAPGTFDNLFAAIHKAQAWARDHPAAKTMDIQLVAAADLTTAEQMRVRFEIASA